MTYAVTVGVSDRPGVHDALVTFSVATRIATTCQYVSDGYTVVYQYSTDKLGNL